MRVVDRRPLGTRRAVAAGSDSGAGRAWRDHRRVIDAIAFTYRTGTPWRDLPERAGMPPAEVVRRRRRGRGSSPLGSPWPRPKATSTGSSRSRSPLPVPTGTPPGPVERPRR
ncbi:transposase [Streptomyces clavifer]